MIHKLLIIIALGVSLTSNAQINEAEKKLKEAKNRKDSLASGIYASAVIVIEIKETKKTRNNGKNLHRR